MGTDAATQLPNCGSILITFSFSKPPDEIYASIAFPDVGGTTQSIAPFLVQFPLTFGSSFYRLVFEQFYIYWARPL